MKTSGTLEILSKSFSSWPQMAEEGNCLPSRVRQNMACFQRVESGRSVWKSFSTRSGLSIMGEKGVENWILFSQRSHGHKNFVKSFDPTSSP